MILRVLLVDDDETFRRTVGGALGKRGFEVTLAAGGEQAVSQAREREFDVALVDLKMPGMDGLELLGRLRREQPELEVVVLTGHGTIPSAIEAIKAGAHHYLTKPCELAEIEASLQRAGDHRLLASENRSLSEAQARGSSYQGIVGASASVRDLEDMIRRVKDSASPVLVEGESGTGKELVARALHFDSVRARHPFVVINCAGLKEQLLESELFGYAEGAFTGATKPKPGLLDVADRGTLFIDEIADMALPVQAGLLRVIETKEFRPVGATRERRVDVRIIAAANRNLESEVEAGRFRADLLFRLNVLRIRVPALRERLEDLPLLVEHFLGHSSTALSKGIRSVPAEALAGLAVYDWPGNIRELFNMLERAVLLSPQGEIDPALLAPPARKGPAGESLEDAERRHVATLLEKEEGNVTRVAKVLGIDRRTLQRKMARWGLKGG
ncbi:MAG: sigma-54-dependent Fis family transcriptional regulator [Planctomycetes bacterium]|nr:sigma-54-dependent Fis family transcriptional regulator [Planctomycetota bacterium]